MTRHPLHGPCLLLVALSAACARPAPPPAPPLQAVHARPLTDVRFERTAARVERGRYLANAVIGCVLCHSERDDSRPGAPPVAGREFAGAVLAERPGYRLVAPNLTPDVETGAGSWSDDMLARAVREGVGHDGRGLGGQMWWWAFRALSDEDLASIVVYLRSLPPVRHALPPRLLPAAAERERAERALPLTEPVPEPDLSDPVERGVYLIGIADCMGCHTAWEAPRNPGFGGGGNLVERTGERIPSANLTADASGLGGYTAEIFLGVLRSGRGGTLHTVMPWAAYREMTDGDLRAIYAALRVLPPVAHRVHAGAPPTPCQVCGQSHGLGALNGPPRIERVEADLGPLEPYAGVYRLGGDRIEILPRQGRLYISEWGRPQVELVPIAGGRLHAAGITSPISFERGPDGGVSALLTHDFGPTRWARER